MRTFTLRKTLQLDADALCPTALQNSSSGQSETRASMTIAVKKIANSNKPERSAVFGAHHAHRDGRPPLRRIRLIEVWDVPNRIAGLLFGQCQFACDLPPDRISGMQKNAAFVLRGGTIFNGRGAMFDKNHARHQNQRGQNRSQQHCGEWSNAEIHQLLEVLETATDHARRKAAFRRVLEICKLKDRADTVLQQNAFTAKRKALRWKGTPAFAMYLRRGNHV